MTGDMTPERWRSMSEYERCAWLEENADRIVVKSYATGEKSLGLLSELRLSERAREVIALSERAAPPHFANALNDLRSNIEAALKDVGE